MIFNSFQFLLFFPSILVLYWLVPKTWRYPLLLLASYWFYMSWNAKYAFLLLFSTLITYAGARLIHCCGTKDRRAKTILAATIAANLLVLFYFKYANFLLQTLGGALQLFRIQGRVPVLDVLLPVGISFYIFQALGYAVDVYRGDLEPEKNIFRYALFVSFFPQLVAGPIERARNLLPQIQNLEKVKVWDFGRMQRGCLTMLAGFAMKMLVADRAALVVNAVFNNHASYSAGMHAFATFLFTIQIYCDFAGYSCIAIGAARIMGVELMENFRRPFLSQDFKEFWGRWHISLSSWFMDYLYIPLGGNRKGRLRKYVNLLVVFTVSGLWHGAAWHFVLWGALHAVYRIAGDCTAAARKRLWTACGVPDGCFPMRAAKIAVTFFLTSFAFLFFRAESTMQGLQMVKSMVSMPWSVREVVQSLPIRREECVLLLMLLAIMLFVEILKERGFCFEKWFERQIWPFRALYFLCGIVMILLFGVYGPNYGASTFIYFQF